MNRDLFYLMVILAIILLCIWNYRNPWKINEGFQQNQRFLLKTEADTYDAFYGEIYDTICKPPNYEMDEILKAVQPDPRFSTFLDAGCGTSDILHYLKSRGYKAYGIDQSHEMIEVSKRKYPEVEIKCDRLENPMAFDRALFTHILCMNRTIYEIEDKLAFFKNCYYWLQNGGYLIVHLTNDTLSSTNSSSDFGSFVYTSTYTPGGNNKIIFKESFVDKQTENIRQNERTLYTESNIMEIAKNAGFTSKGLLEENIHDQFVIFTR